MDAIAAITSQIVSVQQAYRVISTLGLLSYIYPDQQPNLQIPEVYDAIVVGAGSAGSVVASRLTDANFKVLLIEAGGDPPIETQYPSQFVYALKSHIDWNYTNYDSSCQECQRRVGLPRGKTIGGSGSINNMYYVRGSPYDFDTWADIVNDPAWSWDAVLPFFKKSEGMLDVDILNSELGVFHGTNGPMKVTTQVHKELNVYLKAFEELGHKTLLDVNGNETIGFGHPAFNIAEGKRWSSAYAFLPKLKSNPNFHILKNTLVTKITFDESGKANGVEAKTQDGRTVNFKASKEVILTAGAFNSPHILLLSGIGPQDHLTSFSIETRADLPVGQKLQDHFGIYLVISMDSSKAQVVPPLSSIEYPAYTLHGYVALNNSQVYPDYQVLLFRPPDDKTGAIVYCSPELDLENEYCKQFYDVATNRTVMIINILGLHMKARGQVSLRSSNPEDLARVSLGWFDNEKDGTVDDAVNFIEDFLQVLNTTYFKSVDGQVVELDLPTCKYIPKGTREYWSCYVREMWITHFHYAGTCALGSVVQSDLKVIGVPGLRVADSSVMPIVVSGNTNAPTVMIAEKAAQYFIDEYGSH